MADYMSKAARQDAIICTNSYLRDALRLIGMLRDNYQELGNDYRRDYAACDSAMRTISSTIGVMHYLQVSDK